MAATSPLDHSELRQIEQTLDEGNTQEAATRLGQLGDARDHKDAIDFLTTRLLFQRGRIDSDGAADRVGAILERVEHFPEAEDWLTELEARTERIALSDGAPKPTPAATASLTPPPPSQAPSIPRDPGVHPYFDELGPDDDDVTPTEAGRPTLEDHESLRLDSSDPPPRPTPADVPWNPDALASQPADNSQPPKLGSEPPTRPDHSRPRRTSFDPPTRPDLAAAEVLDADASPHPSYKPFDSLRAKEQLSAQAGRYRGGANDPGEVLGGPRRTRAPQASRHSSRAPQDPERRIIEAFQLVRDGQFDEARRLIPDEGVPTTARPELRAMLGRVLLELGLAERASGEAAYALDHTPQSVEVRLLYVWSAVRYARQRDDAWSLERAGRLLKDMPQGAVPDAGLFDALAACVEVRVGVPTVALRLAQRALRSNGESVDGLAALAEASALCGEEQRAEAALDRLHALSEEAAEQLAPRLRRLGIGSTGPASSASVWLPLEHTLSSGARDVALMGVESLAAEHLRKGGPAPWQDSAQAGRDAAEFLALAPVLRHFGPFDLSLHGLDRVEAGLELLYGVGPRALDVEGVSQSLWQIVGAYLGETLRWCCDGRWLAPPENARDAALELLGGEVQPYQVVRRRILHGRHARLRAALAEALDLAPPAAHGVRSSDAFAPALPWGDGLWPAVEELPRFGRALSHSVVAAYAAATGLHRLDRSGASLATLDRYLELVAPADSPLGAESNWTRWLCVFIGAYLGEVLCKEFRSSWAAGDKPDAEAFVVHLGSRREAPLAIVLDAITGRHPLALSDYLDQLRHTLGSP